MRAAREPQSSLVRWRSVGVVLLLCALALVAGEDGGADTAGDADIADEADVAPSLSLHKRFIGSPMRLIPLPKKLVLRPDLPLPREVLESLRRAAARAAAGPRAARKRFLGAAAKARDYRLRTTGKRSGQTSGFQPMWRGRRGYYSI